MDLDEFLWKNKILIKKIAKEADCSIATISTIRHKKRSPSLLIALKLFNVVDGHVSLYDMLSDEDKEEFESWCKKKLRSGYSLAE